MRTSAVLACLALSACGTVYALPDVSEDAPIQATKQEVVRSANSGIAAFKRVAARVEPVAQDTCRAENPGKERKYCDFVLNIDTRADQPPNAFQSRDKNGRPVITFNVAMLRTIRNDDEIAFILGHEAGHQIADHLGKTQGQAVGGGLAAGALASILGASDDTVRAAASVGLLVGSRAYSKSYELEADVLGTYIADRAGYDPRNGARSFSRFQGSKSLLSTHPPSGQRLATVNQVAMSIDAQRKSGRVPQIPRR